ncbi:DUF2530 domain-containing protein [Kineosporia sp. A_224]|uniref:DUF2530 domain-containing protein n=1 Tax=Kineosporia sp. A_224 TaxID=1962180 RepID=UPI000B4A752C|nr:DUF2530 domain-containing protein [Kineosporia sp. A_224]
MRLYVRSRDRRPDPEPVRTDDRRTVLVGTAVWAVLLVAALVGHGRLSDAGRGWWVWTPVVGIALGLYGLRYLRLRDERPAQPPKASSTS